MWAICTISEGLAYCGRDDEGIVQAISSLVLLSRLPSQNAKGYGSNVDQCQSVILHSSVRGEGI